MLEPWKYVNTPSLACGRAKAHVCVSCAGRGGLISLCMALGVLEIKRDLGSHRLEPSLIPLPLLVGRAGHQQEHAQSHSLPPAGSSKFQMRFLTHTFIFF